MAKVGIAGFKIKIVIAFIVILIASAVYLLGWSSFFTVKEITVVGAPTTVAARIIEQTSQITKGERLARLEPPAVRSLLENISWLDHSTLNSNWFRGSVLIQVWPRRPIATYQGQFVDRAGVVFDLPNINVGDLPLISASDSSSLQFAVSLLTQLPATLRSQLVELKTRGSNSATLTLNDFSRGSASVLQVIWGDRSEMALKVKVYQALIALPENAKISRIDLSAPHAVIVK